MDRLEDARKVVAKLFNIKNHNRIIFTSGCTHSLNLAIQAYKWEKGDGILISSIEHNALSRPGKKKKIVLQPQSKKNYEKKKNLKL